MNGKKALTKKGQSPSTKKGKPSSTKNGRIHGLFVRVEDFFHGIGEDIKSAWRRLLASFRSPFGKAEEPDDSELVGRNQTSVHADARSLSEGHPSAGMNNPEEVQSDVRSGQTAFVQASYPAQDRSLSQAGMRDPEDKQSDVRSGQTAYGQASYPAQDRSLSQAGMRGPEENDYGKDSHPADAGSLSQGRRTPLWKEPSESQLDARSSQMHGPGTIQIDVRSGQPVDVKATYPADARSFSQGEPGEIHYEKGAYPVDAGNLSQGRRTMIEPVTPAQAKTYFGDHPYDENDIAHVEAIDNKLAGRSSQMDGPETIEIDVRSSQLDDVKTPYPTDAKSFTQGGMREPEDISYEKGSYPADAGNLSQGYRPPAGKKAVSPANAKSPSNKSAKASGQRKPIRCLKEILITAFLSILITSALLLSGLAIYKHYTA